MGLQLLFWAVFTVLLAYSQGKLLPAIRRTPYGTIEQKEQDIALHWVGGAAYFLPLLLAPSWLAVAAALGFRILLFDPVLNAAAGDALFHVGQTARTDKILQWVAKKSGWNVQVLSMIFRALAFLILAVSVWEIG